MLQSGEFCHKVSKHESIIQRHVTTHTRGFKDGTTYFFRASTTVYSLKTTIEPAECDIGEIIRSNLQTDATQCTMTIYVAARSRGRVSAGHRHHPSGVQPER